MEGEKEAMGTFELSLTCEDSPTAAPAIANGTLYVVTTKGELVAYR